MILISCTYQVIFLFHSNLQKNIKQLPVSPAIRLHKTKVVWCMSGLLLSSPKHFVNVVTIMDTIRTTNDDS